MDTMHFDHIQSCEIVNSHLRDYLRLCYSVHCTGISLSLCIRVSVSLSLPPAPSPSSYPSSMIHLISQIAAGLFNTMVQTHLLLIMNKTSPEYEKSLQQYREAAKLFQGQVSWEWTPPQEAETGEKGNCMVSRVRSKSWEVRSEIF